MLLSILCAPPNAPQIPAAPLQTPLQPKLDRLDKKIVETVHESGLTKIWSILNVVANEENPKNRTEGRDLRLLLLAKLQRLNRLGLVFFAGRNLVAPEKADPTTTQAASRRRRRTVRKSPIFRPVSAENSPKCGTQQNATQLVQKLGNEPKNRPIEPPQETGKTESDTGAAALTSAAQTLARLPRKQRKKWSGYVDGRRIWRDQKIILLDGSVVYAFGALRGQVVYFRDLPREPEPGRWGAVNASQVKLWKNPAAVALGRRKSGVKERKSIWKLLAAWRNGRKPVRVGRRRRGRPAKKSIAPALIAISEHK